MPISIGEVESTVEVESAGSSGQSTQARPLPSSRDTARLGLLLRHRQWDEARTQACDFDD